MMIVPPIEKQMQEILQRVEMTAWPSKGELMRQLREIMEDTIKRVRENEVAGGGWWLVEIGGGGVLRARWYVADHQHEPHE